MLDDNKFEFIKLFQEFISSYPYTVDGIGHIKSYTQQRQQACRNFEAIRAIADTGENVKELVLLQLLPHSNTSNNRQRGAWINMTPSVTEDIQEWFEGATLTQSENWEQIAIAILNFVCCCNENPEKLSLACRQFSQFPYCEDFEMGMLTPILNALRPDDFLLINNKSQQVINYFANTKYGNKLTEYALVNDTGRNLIKRISQYMRRVRASQLGLT
ncbi:hypothetical protein [Cylindrospermum sp. FACHB-282]|uniref:hypothetical protein n=1 Tax=Cylindrospermum sp. FACHB-282 TaxID=2692794 RepID=UPI00168738B9|nr:hypothetical protein [Cylindrospermum sp. FACHB-282]MBD2388836.1 hypothetical protein [Cylindrospermum sp. FACHB-282]